MNQPDNMAPEWKIQPCNDLACERRRQCLCWGEPINPQWVGFSLFPYHIPITDPCPHFAAREAS